MPAASSHRPTTAGADTPESLVDPLIGTDGADPTEYGGMVPSTAPPFAMTRWTPMTRENGISRCAYHYGDEAIIGFLGSHQPAIWMGDWGQVAVMAGTGPVRTLVTERALPFEHAAEHATAAGYAVTMGAGEGRVRARLTGTSRVGCMEFTFTTASPELATGEGGRHVIVQATRAGFDGSVHIDPDSREISGHNPQRQDAHLGPPQAAGFAGYFVARFDTAFAGWGTAHGTAHHHGRTDDTGEHLSGFVEFAPGTRTVQVRVGISLISVQQARDSLDREAPLTLGFDDVEARTGAAWSAELDRVRIAGGDREDLVTFYTALFHALQYPSELHEYGRFYSGYADDVLECDSAYTAFSLWDTFRAQNALLILLAPDRAAAMARSLLRSYQACGRLPIWENLVETNIMVGTHADSVLAEALVKGLGDDKHGGIDASLAYRAVMADAMVPPERDTELRFADREVPVPRQARAGLTMYLRNGWVAADQTAEAASRTLDYAFDDFAVSQVARSAGHPDVAEQMLARSRNYRHLWNADTGFIQARDADGSWAGGGWTEGSKWPYLFGVLHDIRGLRDLMGRSLFLERLDEHFAAGHNAHDNEPSHHIPYLYCYAGQPWKTQRLVRRIAADSYRARPDGLCGNDDLGQMSAWLLFTALGFYPVNPASDEYVVGSPCFDLITIDLPGATSPLVISAPTARSNVYVAGLRVNGVDRYAPFLRHADIAGGGVLEFAMSTDPTEWGASGAR